jgi:hypothetical protein
MKTLANTLWSRSIVSENVRAANVMVQAEIEGGREWKEGLSDIITGDVLGG